MKVLLLNGSPHKQGCTYTALCEVARSFIAASPDSEQIEPVKPSGF